jgi:hypothetical protein
MAMFVKIPMVVIRFTDGNDVRDIAGAGVKEIPSQPMRLGTGPCYHFGPTAQHSWLELWLDYGPDDQDLAC